MKHWWLNCPYCGARILDGVGGGDNFPEIWVPFFRCPVCCKLISTGSKEFVNIPPHERSKIYSNLTNAKYIAQSLDRTNNKKYEEFLNSRGFEFYPLTDEDYKNFKNVDWEKYCNSSASDEATQSLYNVGILIKEEDLDKKTGEIKREKIIENKRNYEINKKSIKAGAIAGWIIGILFCFIFGEISPNSYLFLLGILFGFIAYFAVSFVANNLYHKNIDRNNSNEQTNKSNHFTLCKKCGMQVFDDEDKCSNCGYQNLKLRDIENQNLIKKKEDEEILQSIHKKLNNWDPTFEEVQQHSQRKKEHSLDRLVDFIIKAKNDKQYIKDISETLIYMYSDDVTIYTAYNKNGFSLVYYENDLYIPLFTDDSLYGQNFQASKCIIGTREMFNKFYKGYEDELFNGIIINPFTDSTIIFNKEFIDGLHLDLLFDVPWKKI